MMNLATKKIPIVMYSGTLTAEIEKEARIAGANEVLGKDIGIPQLVVMSKLAIAEGN